MICDGTIVLNVESSCDHYPDNIWLQSVAFEILVFFYWAKNYLVLLLEKEVIQDFFHNGQILTAVTGVDQVCLGQCPICTMTLVWRLTRFLETTVDTDVVSLPCCEFRAARVLHGFSFYSIPGSIPWTCPCAVRRLIWLHPLNYMLTLATGFGVVVRNIISTESSFAD